MADPLPDTASLARAMQPVGQQSSSKLRPKPQLSCNICKLRKVKCDRKYPCDSCTRHGCASSCGYPDKNIANLPQSRQFLRQNPANAFSKLSGLENLIHSLMKERGRLANSQQSTQQATGQARLNQYSLTADYLPNDFGRLSLNQTETSYVGSEHWAAVIDGIAELKSCLEDTYLWPPAGDDTTNLCGEEGPELFHGHVRSISKEEIIASLPSKDLVDGFVYSYFRQYEHIPIFLHRPTFLKEYERFWASPQTTSILWIGLLFSIMCLGARFDGSCGALMNYGSPYDTQISITAYYIQEYREKTVQCLLAGNYIKPGRYVMETLLLYFMNEHLHHTDGQLGNWILMGQIVRIAMRLGLHRDPSHTPKVSVFTGEIRRRIWTAVVQIDLTTSCQMGLPNMIRESYCDTREPLNLLDVDLDENMTELPEPRPDSFLTPILYICVRNRILSVFGRVSDITNSLNPSAYSRVRELDEELLKSRAAIPAGLQIQQTALSAAHNPDVLMYCIFLDIVFQHARCMLHRKYLIPARTNDRYACSRKTCIEAALALLAHQQTLDRETRPGGQLEERRWKLSSFLNFGVLLGVTVLCVDLNEDMVQGFNREDHWKKPDKTEIIHALISAHRILAQLWDASRDSRKAATAISVILGRICSIATYNFGGSQMQHQVQDLLAAQSPSWSLEEFLGPRFPHYHDSTETSSYSGEFQTDYTFQTN